MQRSSSLAIYYLSWSFLRSLSLEVITKSRVGIPIMTKSGPTTSNLHRLSAYRRQVRDDPAFSACRRSLDRQCGVGW